MNATLGLNPTAGGLNPTAWNQTQNPEPKRRAEQYAKLQG